MMYEPTFLTVDARKLPIPSDSIDLIVTSPPYFNIDTVRYGGDPKAQLNNTKDKKKFLKLLLSSMKEMERVLNPRGSIWINVGTYPDIPFDFVSQVINNTKLTLLGDVHWRYPEVPAHTFEAHYHNLWFHFVKSKDEYYRNIYTMKRYESGTWTLPMNNLQDPIDAELSSIAFINDAFPSEFPKRFIEMFTKPGHIVLDPFGGSGVAAAQAFLLDRKSISNDISLEQTAAAKARIERIKQV